MGVLLAETSYISQWKRCEETGKLLLFNVDTHPTRHIALSQIHPYV